MSFSNEHTRKTFNYFQKLFILDVGQSSEYVSDREFFIGQKKQYLSPIALM